MLDQQQDVFFEKFDSGILRDFLKKRIGPVMEAELIRFITGEKRIPCGRAALFSVHFSLYHALYMLRENVSGDKMYLHLDPMRIRLIELPEERFCHYYFPEKGGFCNRPVRLGTYCDYHEGEFHKRHMALVFDYLRDFYINPENVSFGESELLEKLMNGCMVYAFKAGEIKKALGFFGLTSPDKELVRKRYYELAKEHHPDRNNADDTLMKKLNSFYSVLCEVYIL